MSDFDKDKLLELSELLLKLDKKIKKAEDIDENSKQDFKKLAKIMEQSFDNNNREPSKEIHELITEMGQRLESTNPKITKTMRKILGLCHELGI